MGQALYRQHRPRKFSDVVGQDHITKTLSRAIASGRISHAYLFTGPRGVGKTSVARIFAHEVNKLPYKDDAPHLDIIEIDAASNRRIDEIRELRDKVHITPTSAEYKVYIIDEVHMLTREAFNALLKTLEEPPKHAIFILATTEAHKLPETIISRTQRFEFKPIGGQNAASHLADIAKREKVDIEKGALELLAAHGRGSFRDSISLLDQLNSTGSKITEQTVRDFLGLPAAESVEALVSAISSGDSRQVIAELDNFRAQGANAATTAALLAKRFRTDLSEGRGQDWTIALLRHLVEVPASSRPDDNLEIALLEAALTAGPSAPAEERAVAPEPKPQPKKAVEQKEAVKTASVVEKPKASRPLDDQSWADIVKLSKTHAASIYTALRLAVPEINGSTLTLYFQFPLHQKKLEQAKNKDLLQQVIAEVAGKKFAIKSEVDKAKAKPGHAAPKADTSPPPTISNIFGASEVLES